MFQSNSFGQTLDILHRSMDVSLLRRSTIADNISNADTPNFKRSVINFESELKRALDSRHATGMKAALTDNRHIRFRKQVDYRSIGPRRVLDFLSTADNNGNNVDIEEESMLLLRNQLNYEIMTRMVTNQFGQMNLVLK
ncbi:MAG: flagellar basal body rod protein FlgB [Spirochaetales bacterium]|nr:flagellar basal body rod protein FlgB [Spirochaetales bacterium]